MEKRLKKERNKLFRRVILILLAVWLAVSAAFCAVRLNIAKVNAQNRELSKLSGITRLLSYENITNESINRVFLEYTDFIYESDGEEPPFDSQLVIGGENNSVIADTARSIGFRFYTKSEGNSVLTAGILNYDAIRDSLSDEQFERIKNTLNIQRSDGKSYELVCTKAQTDIMITPTELKLVLKDEYNELTHDKNCETFDLSQNKVKDVPVSESSEYYLNIIPKDFLLSGKFNRDLMGALTKQQKKSSAEMFDKGAFNYLFYGTDSVSIGLIENGEKSGVQSFQVKYAKELNLFDSCKYELLWGCALIFGFFLTIALILCVMIWRTVKAQLIQEQRRLDLTNALAHDIKTPLFVISGYAYSLKENIDETEREKYLDNIIEQTDSVNSLVQKMLDFSKLDSYKMTLNKTDFDLSELTERVLQNYTALPEGKSVSASFAGSGTITADRELIKSVLQNLIDNAVKYSLPESEIHVEINGGELTVKNKSEPISRAEIKKLWQPYAIGDKSRSKKGNGLGLSIVKSILDLHGAKYNIEMNGDMFTFTAKFKS